MPFVASMLGGQLDQVSEDEGEAFSGDSQEDSIVSLPNNRADNCKTLPRAMRDRNKNPDDDDDNKNVTPVARMSQATVLLFDPRSKHRHELRDEMESLVKKVANILYESSLISPSRRPHSRALFQQK